MSNEKKKKPELLAEIKKLDEKISELTTKLEKSEGNVSDLTIKLKDTEEKISDQIVELNNYKNKEIELKGQVQKLQTEIKYMEANQKNIDILNERVASLEKEKVDLKEKLELKESKIEELQKEKEALFKDKTEILEDKTEILVNMKGKELELKDYNQKLTDLRDKFKKSSSELLSKSMEIDKLVKKDKEIKGQESVKVQDLVEKIRELEDELECIKQSPMDSKKPSLTQDIAIIDGINDFYQKIKEIIPQAKSNIRMVIPKIGDILQYEIINVLNDVSSTVRINIAANIENPIGDPIVNELKKISQITNYSERKIIALNIDSSIFLIGMYKEDDVFGIYTELLEFIEIFKPAIMEPFLKGRRI